MFRCMWVSEVMMVVVVADSGDDGRAAVKMNQRITSGKCVIT